MMRALIVLVALSFAVLTGCAQDVPDLDRSQPNRIKKSDLTSSDWYTAQTVTEVPTTDFFSFVGETSMMERIRWDIQENYLIAYRSYPKIEGSDPDEAAAAAAANAYAASDDPNATPPPEYTENPVAAFPITSHFDIQRSYDSSTGEQTNVVDENSFDRPWYERQYIRVDWSTNLITNYDFITQALFYTNLTYFVSEEQGGPDAMTRDTSDRGLEYFDFVSKVHIEPDFYGCMYSWYGWWPGDCTAGEIKIRNSFLRAEKVSEYEPVQYDDRLMTKFGYFRTERFGWDPWRSVVQSNRSYLPNRFSIWEEVWEKDADGNVVTNDEGRPMPIPMTERTPKPITYYVSDTLPEELWPSAVEVAADWNDVFRNAVAVTQGKALADVPEQMFIVCRNPVTEEDAAECGEPGMQPRIGDIRYSTMFWVNRYTQAGLLGYGPSGADPLTGETKFGSAYVYGTEIDNYAQWATDLVRLMNGDLTDEDVEMPDYIREEIQGRLTADPSRPATGRKLGDRPRALKNMPTAAPDKMLNPRKRGKLTALKRRGIEDAPYERDARVMHLMQENGLDDMLMSPEIEVMATRGQYGPNNPAPADVKAAIAPSQWASSANLNQRKKLMMEAAKKNLYLRAFADDAIVGLAKTYAGTTDYDTVREEIREAIFKAVMLHEVGHTLGLRHNFAGSYDSLNYADEYWELRKENLTSGASIDDLYAMTTPTQAQLDGSMIEFQYSSIMDYGMRFNSDIRGLGKYDNAAIVFGYSSGTYDLDKGPEPGYVEVYANPGNAKSLLKEYEDPDSLAFPTLLEEYHYTTVANAFGDVAKIADRDVMKYDDLLAERADDPAGSPPEVSYMFCSDEWAGVLVSCDVFDTGADPFEIARNHIQHYRDYYSLNHFHRDRIFLWSEDILYSMYSRYFSPITNLYQNWVFAYFYGTSDVTMDNYYLFAAISGFNLLADVLLTPPSGSYFKDTDGKYYDYWDQEDPDADLFVPRGVGQPLYTDYQWESGYYYFDRTREIGHFWDYLAAMFAITDSEAVRLGVDQGADELAYSIPWYLFFEFELHDIINTIYTRDTSITGPYVDDGEVVKNPLSLLVADDGAGGELYFDPETGREVPDRPATSEEISLGTTFTQEMYGVLYGMAFFTSNYSESFPDNFKVFRLGAGEALDPGTDFEVISFTDPDTGQIYAALSPIGATFDTGATLMIKQGIKWTDAYTNAATQDDADNAYYEVRDVVDRVNLLRGLYDVFGWTFY